MSRLLLSLGSNKGSRVFNCIVAVHRLAHLCMGEVVKISPFYLTEPVGVPPQPWFINCTAELSIGLSPRELLRACQQVEAELGRTTKGDSSPRTIDIDILFYDQRVVDTSFLQIPHPRLHKRRFVLLPLYQIAPDYPHPTLGKRVSDLLKDREEDGVGEEVIRISTSVCQVVESSAIRGIVEEFDGLK